MSGLGKVKMVLSSSMVKWRHFHTAQVVNVGGVSREATEIESGSRGDGIIQASIGSLTVTDARRFGVCGYELVKTLQEKWFIEPLEIH